jgi:CheY-like chemotaxis protein
MPLHVLLADDSVPAQNMGKKILVDAGYDVLTVSNGLEALRKIAENAPDIAILDIFMPGYTGLEICERLRASAATAALPVILTVGKLEPYRPEDGEHVHSNAVIGNQFGGTQPDWSGAWNCAIPSAGWRRYPFPRLGHRSTAGSRWGRGLSRAVVCRSACNSGAAGRAVASGGRAAVLL